MELDKRVLITGVGGNVGQGVIRNINSYDSDIVVIGTNIEKFSSGNHLCDIFYKVPYAVDKNYIATINSIVDKENVDLIIPTTDYEVFVLSKHVDHLNCEIAVSSMNATKICLDKMETHNHFNKFNIPFAKAFLPSDYNNEFKECIVKPREGRGSRGIQVNPSNLDFSDDYMIQELHRGIEVTIAFYVDKKGDLHGFVVQERTLENGTTKNSKITKVYDALIEPILKKIIKVTPIKGSANLQAIITSTNEVFPFEVNCRISGTNSMRAQFGFKDVQYTIEEWLLHKKAEEPIVKEGVATRIIMDVIYTEAKDYSEINNKSSNHYIF